MAGPSITNDPILRKNFDLIDLTGTKDVYTFIITGGDNNYHVAKIDQKPPTQKKIFKLFRDYNESNYMYITRSKMGADTNSIYEETNYPKKKYGCKIAFKYNRNNNTIVRYPDFVSIRLYR